jgi:hypothetical protein
MLSNRDIGALITPFAKRLLCEARRIVSFGRRWVNQMPSFVGL